MALNKQMELFDDGGLMDEGGSVDPVSGNDVPSGSTQEEVRDDIPAQLSEGEFVLPADVVRFHGLEKIMALRDEAKAGLSKMEAMGQMGNSDEATLDDDVPFSMEDLDMEDDGVLDYNVGGVVQQQSTGIGGYQPSQFSTYVPPQIPQYQPAPVAPTYQMPTQQAVPVASAPTAEKPAPSFSQLFQGKAPTSGELDNREYINPETGEKRVFTFIGDTPSVPIPTGFVSLEQYKPEDATITPSQVRSTTATVRDTGGRDFGSESIGPGTAGTAQIGGTVNSTGLVDNTTTVGITEHSPLSQGITNALGNVFGKSQSDSKNPTAPGGLTVTGVTANNTFSNVSISLTPEQATQSKSKTTSPINQTITAALPTVVEVYKKDPRNNINFTPAQAEAVVSLQDIFSEAAPTASEDEINNAIQQTIADIKSYNLTPQQITQTLAYLEEDPFGTGLSPDPQSIQSQAFSQGMAGDAAASVSSGSGAEATSFGQSVASDFGGVSGGGEFGGSDSGVDAFGGNDMIAEGGYIHKGRKPSVKKQMKQSGLASKN